MKEVLKKYFIPGAHNDFHPLILHRKRALFYGGFFLAAKVIVLAFVAVVTPQAFVLPEVMAEEQKQIIALTNEIRAEKGLPPLSADAKLGVSSSDKAQDMAANGYFAHANGGKNLSYWISAAGYHYAYAGENLAVGFSTAEQVVGAWEKSPAHYANLIDSDYSDVGVGLASGVYKGQPAVFVAQHLAQPEKMPAPAAAVKPEPAAPAAQPVAPAAGSAPASAAATPASAPAGRVAGEEVIRDTMETPPIANDQPTNLIGRYLAAKKDLGPVTGIFGVEDAIYLAALVFFLVSLAIMIFVAIRVQRPRAIAWTCALIVFLAILWKF